MSVKNKINSINLWLKKNTSIDEQILSIKKFETGQSNPTFLLKSDNKSFVLRSKPLGNLLRGAHRIDREYKAMSALSNSKIPTPPIALDVPLKYVSTISSERPTASKICAPQ